MLWCNQEELLLLAIMPAIEILGLAKTYSTGFWRKTPKVALQPLHLSIERGEVFGFLGPNGAGKTTTIKLLLGLVTPSAGTARILEQDFRNLDVRRRIGFLPEQPYFYDHLSATELLDYYAQLSGMTVADRKKRIPELLDRVGLSDTGSRQLRKFSKGMLQRVGIAQAIVHDPEVLILDEPMSGLDPLGRREVRELIEELKDRGKTIFFSTHILSDAEALCERVAIVYKGELRGTGAVTDFTSSGTDRVEIVWQGTEDILAADFVVRRHRSGTTTRALVDAAKLDSALDMLRQKHARLISVTPVQGTLEDYFLAHTSGSQREKS